jgi:hypothetical protein
MSWSSKQTTSFVFFLLLLISGVIAWTLILRNRRNSFISSARGIWSLVLTSGIWSIFGVFWNVSVAFDWACLPTLSIGYLFHCIIAFYFIERCFLLIIQFSVNKQAVYLAKSTRISGGLSIQEVSINETTAVEKEKERESTKGKDSSKSGRVSRNSLSTSNSSFKLRIGELPFEKKSIIEWIFKNRKYFDHTKLFSMSKLVAFVFVLIAFIPGVSTFASMENPNAPTSSASCFHMMLIFQRFALVTSLIACIAVIDCCRRLMKVQDSYFIKIELIAFSILLPIALVFSIYLGVFPVDTILALEEQISVFGITVQGLAVFYVHGTLWFILIKMKKQNIEPSEDSKVAITEVLGTKVADLQNQSLKEILVKVLHNRKLRANFKEYLVSSFCVENLLFWEAVETLRLSSDSEKSIRIATQIFEEYCIPNAHFLVNISGALIKRINNFFTAVDKKDIDKWLVEAQALLYEAQEDTFSLMCHDSFRRFVVDYFTASAAEPKEEKKKVELV